MREVTWGALKDRLPGEDEDAAISLSASDVFCHQVAALLHAIVPCDRPSAWTRRALGTWCHWYASQKPGEWCRAEPYLAWGRVLSDGFQIAIMQGLAAQISQTAHRAIAEMTPIAFGRQCQLAGITTRTGDNRVRFDGERHRVTFLSSEFISSLLLSTDHSDPLSEALHRTFQGSEPDSGPKRYRKRGGESN
jgi:hypothetical protein